MTDNEIIKALECCVKDKCSDCPAKAMFCDANVPMAFALDLINRQSKEIGRLEKSNRNWRRKVQRLRAECDEIA